MRILQVTISYYPELQYGGPPQKIRELSLELVRRGHSVEIVTTHSDQFQSVRETSLDGIPVRYLRWFGWGLRRMPISLTVLLHSIKRADVMHCYGLYDALCPFAIALARLTRTPYVLEPLGMYVPRARHLLAKRVYHQLITKRMAGGAAGVVATSPAEAAELRSLCSGDQLVERRNGIDLTVFEGLPSGEPFRAQHDIPVGERVVLYIGRISPIKNLEQLVVAFDQAGLKNARLVLVGPVLEQGYARRLERLIQQRGMKKRVLLAGPVFDREKLSALAAADLLVLPSIYESFGNSAAEAVAAGVPVLLTETCGIAPLIHKRAGLAVPTDTDALARGMRTLLDNREQRDVLTSSRPDVVRELSWEDPIQQTEMLYRRALGTG